VQLEEVQAAHEKATARVVAKYSFSQSAVDKPLPSANLLLKPNEALIDYFITRKWRVDRESADPLDDERLYAIVTRKEPAAAPLRSRRSAPAHPCCSRNTHGKSEVDAFRAGTRAL